jgi:hypothetical protein
MMQYSRENTDGYASLANLTENDRHRLLASERRRVVLDILGERSGPVSLEELATAVTATENDTDAPDKDAVERVRIALHHKHLPKMADLGIIDYDLVSQQVE